MQQGKSASEQPGNSWKYLYPALGEKKFQQLCGALLRLSDPDVRCFPVGMSDGGRDAVSTRSGAAVVYQVKWSSKLEKNPVTWLTSAIAGERGNIERLIRDEGATKYVLMTSVAGTSQPRTGSIDKLEAHRVRLSQEWGIEVQILWQTDIDSMVDLAPDPLKWTYDDMLIGRDLIRFLIHGSQVEGAAAQMRETLLKVMSTQWGEDAKVKLTAVDMDHLNIVDLFVDVEEILENQPNNVVDRYVSTTQQARGAGALQYLLSSTMPLTIVRGEPGQGKSTLGQYLCQVHRAAILPENENIQGSHPEHHTTDPKLALRTDLRDYATWLEGKDPYGDSEPPKKPKRRSGAQASLEAFLADYCAYYSGGRKVTAEQVQHVLERYPVLVVLDGLDEVADPAIRKLVVQQIDHLARRMGSTARRRFQLIVTTRPNATNLPEPSADMFETIRLSSLSPALQAQYITKWSAVHHIRGAKRRRLTSIFRERARVDHVAQLAVNPMQLTILLYLVDRRGDAVPTARTPLYSQYMDALLDREVERGQISKDTIPWVRQVTAYLGWQMQSGVETNSQAGRLTIRQIKRTLLTYLYDVEGPTDLVDTIFTAAIDRFWALSSKVEQTFEFPVQPVREYFAARYLAHHAGTHETPAQKQDVLRELVDRSYWLNTARFYAGFANPNELAALVHGLQDAMEAGRHPLQERVAVWALLEDGIFATDTRARRAAAALLSDDLSIRLLTAGDGQGTTFSNLSPEVGGADLAAAVMAQVFDNPRHPLAVERIRLLRRLNVTPATFDTWWEPHLAAAAGTADEATWLAVGAAFQKRRIGPVVANGLTMSSIDAARQALAAGVTPAAGSPQNDTLLQAVLDGHCTDISTLSTCHAGDLLKAIRPQQFLVLAQEPGRPCFAVPTQHLGDIDVERRNRSANFTRLIATDNRYQQLRKASSYRLGEAGTTAPWQNTARALTAIHGPTWLATEIAVTGAATQHTRTGGNITRNGAPSGPDIDYGTFVEQIRARRASTSWWTALYAAHADSLSRRTWVLALLTVADQPVVTDHLSTLIAALHALDDNEFNTLAATSSRLGASGIARRVYPSLLGQIPSDAVRAQLLVTHHVAQLDHLDTLDGLTETALTALAGYGAPSWPALNALTARMLESPSQSLLKGLRACGPHGFTAHILLSAPATPFGDAILQNPSHYPLSWVLAAERWHSQEHTEPPMTETMKTRGWIPNP